MNHCVLMATVSLGTALGAGTSAALGGGVVCERNWTGLDADGVGADAAVNSAVLFDDGTGEALYVAGPFATAGGGVVNGIARWDGETWSGIDAGGNLGISGGEIHAMEVFDAGTGPQLYVAGDFDTVGGESINGIARWNGTEWAPLSVVGSMAPGSTVYAMEAFDDGGGPALYIGGDFVSAGGIPITNLARWDASGWSAVIGPDGDAPDGPVYALETFNDGTGPALFVGGSFQSLGGNASNNIARWNGSTWSSLIGAGGQGTTGEVRDMVVSGGLLYVAGFFVAAGGQTANGIAAWDGTEWASLIGPNGTGIGISGGGGGVNSVVVYDDGTGEAVYIGGEFEVAGGVPSNGIARWNGSTWQALPSGNGTGVDDSVNVILPYNQSGAPALLVGGSFGAAGDAATNNIAVWGCEAGGDTCPDDVTGDGTVDLGDLNLVLANFGQTTSEGDVNGDGVVDLADLNGVLGSFGSDCPD